MNTADAQPMETQAKENEPLSPSLTSLLLAYYDLAAAAGGSASEGTADDDDDMPPELIDVTDEEVKALQEEQLKAMQDGMSQLCDAPKDDAMPKLCDAQEDEESLFVPRDIEAAVADVEGIVAGVEGTAAIEAAGADENTAPTYLNDTDAESDWDDAIHGGMRIISKGKAPANPLNPLGASVAGNVNIPLSAGASNLAAAGNAASLPLFTTAVASVVPNSLFSVAVASAAARDPIPLLAALAPPMPAFFVHSATPQAASVRRKRGSQK
ncbi:hypothetical protein K523DRAFT_374432 [Schizophyllum commune Tattone D]|nr:hypothetical protein K523DRAFT_374432 [Schizophyllum commune Tattone D]